MSTLFRDTSYLLTSLNPGMVDPSRALLYHIPFAGCMSSECETFLLSRYHRRAVTFLYGFPRGYAISEGTLFRRHVTSVIGGRYDRADSNSGSDSHTLAGSTLPACVRNPVAGLLHESGTLSTLSIWVSMACWIPLLS